MNWKSFVLGFVIGLLLVPFAAFLYLEAGAAPVATSASPLPLEKFLANMALHRAIGSADLQKMPIEPNEANLLAGAREYREECAVCHGLPGQPEPKVAKGEFPKPPQLFRGKGVTDDPAGETYWKIKNGIRLSGMPAYGSTMGEQEMWQIAALLANADKITPAVRQELAKSETTTQ